MTGDELPVVDREWECVPFPPEIKAFIDQAKWRWSHTLAKSWPHWYLVKDKTIPADMLLAIAQHIEDYGVDGRWYNRQQRHHYEDGLMYWALPTPPEKTTVINRTKLKDTYASRILNGTLPRRKKSDE